jgi:1-pyrroline-5-carboxylate dehydrogenase
MTIAPVMTWNNEKIKEHIDRVLTLSGAKVLMGGKPLSNHKIPSQYGSYEPTAIFVPLKHFRGDKKFKLLTTELFGPFSIITEYGNSDVDRVLEIFEGMSHHLTAAVVSNDIHF